jgi:hypothetical protein
MAQMVAAVGDDEAERLVAEGRRLELRDAVRLAADLD